MVYRLRLTGFVAKSLKTGVLEPKWHQYVEVYIPKEKFHFAKFDYFDECFEEMKKALKEKFDELIAKDKNP